MSKNKEDILTVKKIFIASPGDLMAERVIFRNVINKVNKIKAISKCLLLKAVGWEDTLPNKGRPQELINKDVIECDLMVMLLWKRWGSPTGKYSSGFEEEFELARKHDKKTWLHFRDIPGDMMADPGEQLKQVLDFRDKIEEGKEYLCKRYADDIEWKEIFEVDLCCWLDSVEPVVPDPIPSIVVIDPARSTELTLRIAKMESSLQEKDKQLNAFIEKTCFEAQELADAGQLTKAEQMFAHACANSNSLRAWNMYGAFLIRLGSLSKAEEMFLQVIDSAEPKQEKIWLASAHGNLGIVYEIRGDLDKAEKMYRKSLAINEELGRKEGMANQYANLGLIYETRGDLDKAEEMLRKSLDINEELGRKGGMANQYGNLGLIYQTRGDLDKAEEMYRKSLDINEELGRKEEMAKDFGNIGVLYQARGDLDKAEEMYRKSLAINKELGYKVEMATLCFNLGLTYQNRGALDQAENMYQQALELFTEVGMKPEIEKVKDLLEKLRKRQQP